MARRTTGATPAKTAAPAKKAPAKRVVNARETHPTPPVEEPRGFTPVDEDLELPEEPAVRVFPGRSVQLEVRLGNRIVFLQDVLEHTYQMSFANGVLQLQAQTKVGTPSAEDEDQEDGPEDGERPEPPNPNVVLQVHSGDRV